MPPSVKTETERIETEDNVVNPITATSSVSATNTASLIQAKQEDQEEGPKSHKKSRIEEDNNGVICILSDDDGAESDGTINLLDDGDDDDVMVVEPSTLANNTSSASATMEEQIDDDIIAVGDSIVRLPHMRQHCTVHKFLSSKPTQDSHDANSKHCDLCYCFVCDVPVSECKKWISGNMFAVQDHCHATDKGPLAFFYKKLRDSKKKASAITPSPFTGAYESQLYRDDDEDDVDVRDLDTAFRNTVANTKAIDPNPADRGPWASTQGGAKNRSGMFRGLLTQCRKCLYFNKFDHLNYTKVIPGNNFVGENKKAYPTGPQDYCHACGRVASERDFGKTQLTPYQPKVGDVVLGEKTIHFTIKAHDPRKCRDTGKYWKRNEGKPEWVYDEVEMEEDFFRHQIGKMPTIESVLQAVPVLNEVPEYKGDVRKGRQYGTSKSPAITEANALLLEKKSDLHLLHELYLLDASNFIGLRTCAEWNKELRKGVLTLKVYIQRQAIISTVGNANNIRRICDRTALFSRLLGCWFNVFPFKLSDLTNGIQIKPLSKSEKGFFLSDATDSYGDNIYPSQRDYLSRNIENVRCINRYNEAAMEVSNKLSFYASSHSKDCGVVADSNETFADAIKNITSASIFDDVANKDMMVNGNSLGVTAAASELGIASIHRDLQRDTHYGQNNCIRGSLGFSTYLDSEDCGLVNNLKHASSRVRSRCSTMNGLLQQCENLGHAPADHVDGLNVELFDFQKQAVGWALDREKEGGVERFLWTKVPEKSKLVSSVSQEKADQRTVSVVECQLYYSPILDVFRLDEPSDIRGGLIAAQMGLGKTVISLALVLLNPAPERPISGTKVEDYNATSDDTNFSPSWPPAPKLAGGAPSKRGSIFSRGTLVVCNVSLVGQWIDEAKSKLKNPGLVYSYHGGNRNRNAFHLAQNAIVVTTYAVLQSDAYFHSAKSGDSDYCAPCEQVRWWRIICDESHSIRDSNTKNFKALERITAANKWCVTGTPMNTSPRDLRSQLSFIGINYIDNMFNFFMAAMEDVFASSNRKRRRWGNNSSFMCVGPFLHFMRNIMVRHSITQTSRGSNVAIMSLPPKEEKVIEVEFTEAERREYDRVQENAKNLYQRVKRTGKITMQYLRLQSALLPLRLACSGGQLDEGQIHRKMGTQMEIMKENVLEMNLEEGTECSICLSAIDQPIATKCTPVSHIFCKECINGVFDGADTTSCPFCRTVIRYSEMRDVVPITHKEEDDEMDTDEPKPVKIKKKVLDESDIHFRSKFERLLKELSHIRDNEPGSKSLVFSQFASTLQWMKQELPKHGFQYRTLEGNMSMKKRADALREFQSDPPTTIFLLSMRAGAAGINLTEANRVFLMEPAMNPALEAQAVGRVYRLGQRKPVTVIRMRMKDSFETRLAKVLKRKFDTAKKPDAPQKNDDSGGSNSATNSANTSNKEGGNNNVANNGSGAENSTTNTETETESNDEVKASTNGPENVATLGHMTRDKAELMTEEFDALFGIVEPEDLPEPRDEEEEDSPQRPRQRQIGSFSYRCTCGNCSDNEGYDDSDDSDGSRDNRDCVIS